MKKHGIIPVSGAILGSSIGGINMATGIIPKNQVEISQKETVSQVMERWLYKQKRGEIKTASFNRLLTSFDLLCKYNISEVRLLDLYTDDVQEFLDALARDGYAASTIKKAYNLISGLIRYLIGEGVQVRPAFVNAKVPKLKITKPKRKIIAYSPEEQQRLRSAIQQLDTVGANAALLMIETGMRVGEAMALKWSDIIWQRRAVCIHSTLVNAQSRKKCFVQSSPKSESSNRTIPLSKIALEMLMRIRQSEDGLIFAVSNSKFSIGYNTLRNQIRDVCELAGIEYHGMHVFRHTFATNAFYKGCDVKILSKLLGHASVTITYNTYIHLYGDALEDMRSIVE